MPHELNLNLRLTADGKGFVGEVRVAKEELSKLTGSTTRGTEANNTYTRAARQTEAATRKVGRSFFDAHGKAARYFGVIGGAALAANAARGAVRLADTYTELNNRLALVTASETGLARVREELFEISQSTRTELAANANLYSRIALAVKRFGRTETEVLQVTRLLNKQVAIGGNNAAEAAAGLTQFAQGLASGRLQGDELRSVLENLQGVSEGLLIGFARMREQGQIDFDVTRENIRELAAEGILSAELLLDAILASADDTNAKFNTIATTVSGGLTQVANATLIAVGELDQSIGSSAGVAKALGGIARSMELLDEAILVVGASLIGRYGTAAAVAARKSFLARIEAQRLQLALARMDGISRRAAIGMQVAGRSVATLRAGLALLGGPLGFAVLAAGGIYQFASANDRAGESLIGLPEDVDAFRESLEKLDRRQLLSQGLHLETRLRDEQAAVDAAQSELEAKKQDLAAEQAALNRAIHQGGQATVALLEMQAVHAGAALSDVEQKLAATQARIRANADALARLGNPLDAFGGPGGAVGSAGSSTGRAGLPVDEDEIARRYDATRRALQSARERIEADHAAHIANIESADISKAERDAQRVRADAVRRRQLAALPAGNQALIAVQRALRSETEKLNDTWRDNQRVILAGTVAGSRLRQELLRRNAAERDGAIATLEDTRARESGVLALQNARQENQRLGEQAGLTTAQIDRQNRALARELELRRTYPEATQSVLTALGQELSARDDILARQERQAGLLERYAPDTAIAAGSGQREDDLEALHEQRLLSETEYQRALTESQLIAERERQQAIIELKREGWEQELIEAQGYRDRLAQADAQAAHQRINANAAITLPGQERLLNQFADLEQQSGAARVQTALSVGTELTAAAAGQNRKAFRLHQAASIAQAIVSTYSAAAAAYDDFQTPYNYIAAAAVTAAGLAQVSAIRAQQPPQAFAAGGVVEGATFFSARGIPRGLAGEAGPEAIVPLARGPGGALGVRAFGSASPSVTIAPVIQVTVTESADADPAATGATIGRAIQAVLVPAVRQVLAEEQRSGGLLNREDKV